MAFIKIENSPRNHDNWDALAYSPLGDFVISTFSGKEIAQEERDEVVSLSAAMLPLLSEHGVAYREITEEQLKEELSEMAYELYLEMRNTRPEDLYPDN